MNNKGNLLLFYLNRTGCLEYTLDILEKFSNLSPHIYVRKANNRLFQNNASYLFIPESPLGLILYAPLFLIYLLILSLKKTLTGKKNTFYITAFHPYNILLVWASKVFSIPVFLTIHDYETHAGEKNFLIEYIQKRTMKSATHIIFLSENERAKALGDGLDINKTTVLSHPVPVSPVKHTLPYRYPLKILYLGRILEYKGIQLLIDAIKGIEVSELTIAGEGKWNTLHINDNRITTIKKWVDKSQFNDLLQGHHLIILPYKQASQSGILSHAISYNIPVILSDISGLNEQIGSDAAVFCKPSVESIRHAIQSISEKKYCELKSSMAREEKKAKETWQKQYIAFCELHDLN